MTCPQGHVSAKEYEVILKEQLLYGANSEDALVSTRKQIQEQFLLWLGINLNYLLLYFPTFTFLRNQYIH